MDATDATLALEKISGSGPLLRMQGGSLALRGTAKLRHANGSVVFGTGSTAFYDEATFGNLLADTASGWQISPTRAGETAEVSFLGNSRTAFTAKPWECYLTGNGGVARLTVDSGHSAWMYNNFSVAEIGRESGVGEFLLKRGKFQAGNWNYVYVGMLSEGNAVTGRVEVAAGGASAGASTAAPC